MDRPNKMLSDLNKKEKKPRKKTEKELFEKGTKQKKNRKPKTYKEKVNKRFKQPLQESNSKQKLSKLSKIPMKILDKVFDKGIGAARTAGISRPNVKSEEQWAMGRVYAFIEKVYNKNEPQNQDPTLIKEARKILK